MATRWTVEILDERVEAEITALPADMGAKLARLIDLLEEFGPARLGMPHVRPLAHKLWEIRLTGRDGIARAIYTAAAERRLVILRVFRKKTERTPRREIELALRRAKEMS